MPVRMLHQSPSAGRKRGVNRLYFGDNLEWLRDARQSWGAAETAGIAARLWDKPVLQMNFDKLRYA